MDKDDKTFLIGTTLILTPIIALVVGWPALAFGCVVIACIAFSKTKD